MHPQPSEDAVLFVSARETEVSLIVSSHRSGIDVVILADCSGSMGIGDLSPASESASEGASIEARTFFQKILGRGANRPRNITRIQAVRDALLQLIEKRRRSYGSSSRLALVAFGSRSELRFPSTGMLEIDENTAEATLQQFRDKVATLSDESDGTNIGQALQFAATHLANCGKVGNERLIVLLSDGADWRPKGVEATGEMLSTALEDPVSLMENLHRAMNVKLHAIGISNQQLYQDFLSRTDRTYVEGHAPNHALLRELMIVGGGDAERIGDSSVLDEYFQGLGVGVSHLVEVRPRTTSKVLLDSERNEIMVRVPKRRQVQSIDTQPKLDQLKHVDLCCEVKVLYLQCSKKVQLIGGFDLWRGSFTETTKLLNDINRPVTDEYSFGTFARDLYNLIDEMLIDEIRQKKIKKPSPLKSQITELLHGSKTIEMLAKTRNKLGAHIPDPAVADAYQFFCGIRHIPDNDSVAWARLAEIVLHHINDVLKQIDAVLDSFNVASKDFPGDAESPPADVEKKVLEINADW